MGKTLYISTEILKWDTFIGSWSNVEIQEIKRPYEILSHSESLIKENASDFNLSDSIANLRRALNHRLKQIEDNYKLKSAKYIGMPKGYLELLEEYGLAKPYIIKKLMEIRNKIEHKDIKPPRRDRCRELIDITWYFLKSTDRLLHVVPSEINLDPKSIDLPEKYHLSLNINYSNKKLGLIGWIPTEYLSNKKSETSFKIICSTIHDGTYWEGKEDNEYHRDKSKNDTWIVASLSIDNKQRKDLLKRCLESY
jgi:hypothetical protein